MTLQQRRKDLNLTQNDIAQAIGLRDRSISNWETGTHQPRLTIPQVKKLCTVLGLTFEELSEIKEFSE